MVSGISTSFSRNSLKRGVVIFLLGEVITMITLIAEPKYVIVFGVLSFLGMSMILYDLGKPLFDRIPWIISFIISICLYYIFLDFRSGIINLHFMQVNINPWIANREYLYPLGLTSPGFHSADYFPLIPTFFIFLAGTALSKPIKSNKLPQKFYTMKFPVIKTIGKHSLFIYLVHQPLILLLIGII